jgi:hypothetical protein
MQAGFEPALGEARWLRAGEKSNKKPIRAMSHTKLRKHFPGLSSDDEIIEGTTALVF